MLDTSRTQGATDVILATIDKDIDALSEVDLELEKNLKKAKSEISTLKKKVGSMERIVTKLSRSRTKSALWTGAGGGAIGTVLYIIGWVVKGISTGDWMPPMTGGN